MTLALTLARRELRGGVRGLWVVLLCLALGVGVIAAVGTLRAAVDAGLAADGRALLGGDLGIDGGSPPLRRATTDRAESCRWKLAAGWQRRRRPGPAGGRGLARTGRSSWPAR